ncbi:ParA family protein [Salinibacter ruber]|uniref:ParA family protein n=1 Tax=Salinibacter ruber TaxID=146919 RepID=UPI002072C001|nr:ParA family protein [Salinibacter ruber]
MTVLSVCNHKGGTGKTTTTIHVAAALGLSGWRTLVIDLDPQGFLTHTMGIEEPPSDQSVAAFFDADADPGRIPIQEAAGFDLIPSSSTLTRRMRDLNKPTDVLWVREALQRLDLEYDLLLFDTAAAVTVYSLNALVASQHVLIPVLPEYQSVVGGEQTYQTTQLVENKLNPRLNTRQFLFTQVDARKRIHKTYREYIREKYGEKVLDTIVRTSTSLAKTRDGATTVFDHDSSSRGALDYANATDELVARLQSASEDASSEKAPSAAAPNDLSAEAAPEVSEMLNS